MYLVYSYWVGHNHFLSCISSFHLFVSIWNTMFSRLRPSSSSHSHYCMMRLTFFILLWNLKMSNVMFKHILKCTISCYSNIGGCISIVVVFENWHIVHGKHLTNLPFLFIFIYIFINKFGHTSLICACVNVWDLV